MGLWLVQMASASLMIGDGDERCSKHITTVVCGKRFHGVSCFGDGGVSA